jgi:O-antigen ligase
MIFYYITLLLLPFTKHPLLSYNVGGMTPVKVFGGLALCAAIYAIFRNNAIQGLFKTSIAKCFLVFIILFYASIFVNYYDAYSSDALLRFNSIIIFFITTIILVNTRKRFIISIVLLVLCMDIAALYVFREYLLYGVKYSINYRAGGILGDPNYAALNLLTVVPITFLLAKGVINKKAKFFLYGSLFLFIGAIGMTQSRGGFVGFLVMVFFLLFSHKFNFKMFIFFLLFIPGIIFLLPADIDSRFDNDDYGSAVSTKSRYELLVAGFNMTRENLFFGVGPGNFKPYSSIYNENVSRNQIAHNSYISLAGELGIFGITAFLILLLLVFASLKRLAMQCADDQILSQMAIGMRVGLVGYLTAAIFLTAEYEKILWLLCFLTASAVMFTFYTSENQVFSLKRQARPVAKQLRTRSV